MAILPLVTVYAPPELWTRAVPATRLRAPSRRPRRRRRPCTIATRGDLSCLFSSPSAAPHATVHEELGVLWHDGSDEPPAVRPPPPQPRMDVPQPCLLAGIQEQVRRSS
ncbi:unnamed protein product [Urochloa humidicola]